MKTIQPVIILPRVLELNFNVMKIYYIVINWIKYDAHVLLVAVGNMADIGCDDFISC